MKPKIKQYRYEDLGIDQGMAIERFKQDFEVNNVDKIRMIKRADAVYIYEDELNVQLETTKHKTKKEYLNEEIEEGYLAGNRAFERYSYFKMELSNHLADGKSILIESELENGEEFLKCKEKYRDLLMPELYLCSIVAGIKDYCVKHQISNLKFKITDLEVNIYTSHHTSYYAAGIFLDKVLKPRIKKEA